MKSPIRIRVFFLSDDGEYKLNGQTIDDYIVSELNDGYVSTDIRQIDSDGDRLRVFTNYIPDKARSIIDRGGEVELTDPPLEEV